MRLPRLRLAAAITAFAAIVTGCAGGVAPPPAGGAAVDPAADAWLKQAGMGKYRPATDDWAAIEAAAKQEKEVVVYSLSSRVHDFAKTFTDRYGIEVKGFDLGSTELTEKIRREHDAGVYNADVLFVGDPTIVINEVLPAGYIVNFVPSELVDKIEEDEREPLMFHHYGAKVLMYNADAYPNGPGIDTLWDLTRPEWKGKLTMKDPLKSPENLNYLAGIVEHADEMATLYEQEFGEKLQTTEKNAGFEFLKRLLANSPALTSGDDETAKAIGEKGQKNPPVGLIGASKLRLNKDKDLALAFVRNVKPAVGITYPALLGMANRAPHPNAAKLMIRWMMGDEKGGQGYAPYYVEGDYPSRSDVPLPEGLIPIKELGVWQIDPKWLYDNGLEVRDYWISKGGTTRS